MILIVADMSVRDMCDLQDNPLLEYTIIITRDRRTVKDYFLTVVLSNLLARKACSSLVML